ncbi:hypothetical protein [Asanoa siamensis]|uniref:hypothetical protein n=1 Tax=Asanoa siamensis TaxID=926357 RepID=UPI0019429472|nr:hypothetical protein [Asanoa siamensis]
MAPLFHRLVDDAAVFPPGNAALPDAVTAHREHRTAWYADLVGPLLVPASSVDPLTGLLDPAERLAIGIIGDLPIDRLGPPDDPRVTVRQIEAAVAKRGEDPQPGIARILDLADRHPHLDVYAEVPLTFGLLAGLDTIAEARRGGKRIAAKFRTGGLAAELFPTPVELAAVICACRERELPFKLTAGLHHAIRHGDPETGFTHHGFLNILVAAALAADGAEVAEVAEVLAATDAMPLIEPARARRDQDRGLWVGFGSCSMIEPLTDLIRLGLVNGGYDG